MFRWDQASVADTYVTCAKRLDSMTDMQVCTHAHAHTRDEGLPQGHVGLVHSNKDRGGEGGGQAGSQAC